MNPVRTACCQKVLRISGGSTEMEWDAANRTKKALGDFSRVFVCPYCYPECYRDAAFSKAGVH